MPVLETAGALQRKWFNCTLIFGYVKRTISYNFVWIKQANLTKCRFCLIVVVRFIFSTCWITREANFANVFRWNGTNSMIRFRRSIFEKDKNHHCFAVDPSNELLARCWNGTRMWWTKQEREAGLLPIHVKGFAKTTRIKKLFSSEILMSFVRRTESNCFNQAPCQKCQQYRNSKLVSSNT